MNKLLFVMLIMAVLIGISEHSKRKTTIPPEFSDKQIQFITVEEIEV